MDNNINRKCTLILPVRKDSAQLRRCLAAVEAGTAVPGIVIMDCTAEKEALDRIRQKFLAVCVLAM